MLKNIHHFAEMALGFNLNVLIAVSKTVDYSTVKTLIDMLIEAAVQSCEDLDEKFSDTEVIACGELPSGIVFQAMLDCYVIDAAYIEFQVGSTFTRIWYAEGEAGVDINKQTIYGWNKFGYYAA